MCIAMFDFRFSPKQNALKGYHNPRTREAPYARAQRVRDFSSPVADMVDWSAA